MPNSDEVKGRIKEAAGDLTDNPDQKREGRADRAAGKAKDAIGKAEDKAKHLVDEARDALHRDDD